MGNHLNCQASSGQPVVGEMFWMVPITCAVQPADVKRISAQPGKTSVWTACSSVRRIFFLRYSPYSIGVLRSPIDRPRLPRSTFPIRGRPWNRLIIIGTGLRTEDPNYILGPIGKASLQLALATILLFGRK